MSIWVVLHSYLGMVLPVREYIHLFLIFKIFYAEDKIYLLRFRTRMGNIRGFGGPLSTNWHNRTIRLQHQILRRMRDLGIVPVLPAFAGHVPRAFARLFPDANMTKIDPWNKFKDKYCWYGQSNLIIYISLSLFLFSSNNNLKSD